jgi:hypothetical protein
MWLLPPLPVREVSKAVLPKPSPRAAGVIRSVLRLLESVRDEISEALMRKIRLLLTGSRGDRFQTGFQRSEASFTHETHCRCAPIKRSVAASGVIRQPARHRPLGLFRPGQENVFGVAYYSVVQPNHLETVIVEIAGEGWKYSCYFDNLQLRKEYGENVWRGASSTRLYTTQATPVSDPRR